MKEKNELISTVAQRQLLFTVDTIVFDDESNFNLGKRSFVDTNDGETVMLDLTLSINLYDDPHYPSVKLFGENKNRTYELGEMRVQYFFNSSGSESCDLDHRIVNTRFKETSGTEKVSNVLLSATEDLVRHLHTRNPSKYSGVIHLTTSQPSVYSFFRKHKYVPRFPADAERKGQDAKNVRLFLGYLEEMRKAKSLDDFPKRFLEWMDYGHGMHRSRFLLALLEVQGVRKDPVLIDKASRYYHEYMLRPDFDMSSPDEFSPKEATPYTPENLRSEYHGKVYALKSNFPVIAFNDFRFRKEYDRLPLVSCTLEKDVSDTATPA